MTHPPHQLRHLSADAAASPATGGRPDAAAKLAGQTVYPSDRQPAGALHGAILGSPHPHARILAIDASAALRQPGVHAVVTHVDIPGQPLYGLRVADRPALCSDTVRCIGDPVAAVAADTLAQAEAALAHIRVDYALLPLVDDAEAALAPGAAPVHAGGNLLHQARLQRGDAALAEAGVVHWVGAVYDTPRQMHAFLETEGGTVEPDGAGGWVLHFGCHNPERDRQVVAALLAMPPERVRVVGTPVGGSFGGKDELTVQPIAALLAWKTGRALRLQLRRPQSTDLGVKRHAMRIHMRSGCDAQGRLLLHQVQILADTGAYATHGPEVLDAAVEHASGPYAWAAVQVDARLTYTNNGIAGAFRGFGAVQVQLALERQMHRLAQACGLDGASFRQRNLLPADAPGPLGQQVVPFDGPARVLDVAARHALWAGPRQWTTGPAGRWRHGMGLALIHRSDGFGRGGPNAAQLQLALAADGRIELRCSFTELGQNLLGSTVALVAQRLGCAAGDVRPVVGDSAASPDSGAVAASRATTLVWRALQAPATADWLSQVLQSGAALLGRPAASLRLGPGGLWQGDRLALGLRALAHALGAALPEVLIDLPADETPSPIPSAHHVFGACAALAQVAVDSWTGQLQVQRVVLASALGPVVSAEGYLGQMEGGLLIGQGLATVEALPMAGGHYLARNLDAYLVPTLADAPVMEVIAVENLLPGDASGPRGAGEISVNIAVPAIANAVSTALGRDVTALPLGPAQLLDLLEQAP